MAAMLGSVSTIAMAQGTNETFDLDPIHIQGEKLNRALADAPSSVTVLDGEEVENGANDDLDDLLNNQANVLADEGYQPPAIRGIDGGVGPGVALSAGSQPRIPILVDGVPLPSGDSSNISRTTVWDLDTIEVMRGPQAINTGRNALGGAIRLFTKDPVFEREAALRFRYNDEGDAGVDFMFNTPLLEDQLAFRLAGEWTNGKSYINNFPNPLPNGVNPNDEDIGRLRAKLLYEPESVPGLSVLFLAERNRSEGPVEGIYYGNIDDLTLNSPRGFSSLSYVENVEHDVLSLQAEYEISRNFTAVTRLSRTNNDLDLLDSGEPVPVGGNYFQKELTEVEAYVQFQDLGIASTGVFGVIHSDESEFTSNDSSLIGFNADGRYKNTAIYGEVELDAAGMLPGLAVILGGRLEKNRYDRDVVSTGGTPIGSNKIDETVFLPKFGLRYDLSDASTIGYVYSEGYRIGGIDADLLAPFFSQPFSVTAFDPERMKNHEIYAKTTTADGALDITASAFFYKLENAQVVGAAAYSGSGFAAVGNVPEAEGYGAEISTIYRATDRLTFNANLGLLHTEITEVGIGQSAMLGQTLPRAPETTASLGVSYAHGNGFTASAHARFVSGLKTVLSAPEMDSYSVVDLAMGYETEWNDNTIRFDAYVNNLFDERYQTYSYNSIYAVGAPRTIGASITYKF